MNEQPPVTPYTAEKPNHLRTTLSTLGLLLIFHGVSLILHRVVVGNVDPYISA